MAVNLSPIGGVAGQFFDNNGNPLVGGKLFTYAAGTTTPQVTFTSALGNTPNSNPIILNGGGRVPAEIWLTDGLEYKFVLYSSTDQLIGSWDNITGINSNFVNFVTSEEVQTATAGQTVFTLTTMSYQPGTNNLVVYVDGVNQIEGSIYSFVETDSTTVTFTTGLHVGALVKFVSAETLSTGISNAANVIYDPAGSGAVAIDVQTKLRETVSVKDFGAVGDGVADDTAAINNAMTYAIANNKVVIFDFDATIKVPTDAPTLQDAIDAATATPNVELTINIESGHVLTAGFRITNRDCSFMRITSDDATVTVSPTMTKVSNTDLSSDIPRTNSIGFLAVRSKMPTWDILVDMSATACTTAYELDYQSDGVVRPTKGVINTINPPSGGLNCRITTGSRLQAAQTNWSGGNGVNVALTLNAFANLQSANLSNAAIDTCLDVSRGCVVYAGLADLSNGGVEGIYSRRAFVSAPACNLNGSSTGAWAAIGSYVNVSGSTFDGATIDAKAEGGSTVTLGRATKSGGKLIPSQSIVSKPTTGTAFLRNFNVPGGYGLISYEDDLPGCVEFVTSDNTVSIESATQQSIASLAFATAVNLTGRFYIHSGAIYGPNAGLKITIDGVVVLNDGGAAIGDDSAGNTFSVISIPACKCENSILIEVLNRGGVTADFAWKIYRSQIVY